MRARIARSLSSGGASRNRGTGLRYLIVACTVMTDVPEAVGP